MGRQVHLVSGAAQEFALIPARSPKEAVEKQRRLANEAAKGDAYPVVANPAKGEPVGERALPIQSY
jgi:hypothetical protein